MFSVSSVSLWWVLAASRSMRRRPYPPAEFDGVLPTPLAGATAVRTSAGERIYVVGDYPSTSASTSPINGVEEYNPATDTWRFVGFMPMSVAPRRNHGGVAARIFVIGGQDAAARRFCHCCEAYLRLVGQKEPQRQNRGHFFAIAAQMMRRILVDYARRRLYAKRGGGAYKVSFDEVLVASGERAADVITLDGALTTLAELDQRKSKMVELRFFGGPGH